MKIPVGNLATAILTAQAVNRGQSTTTLDSFCKGFTRDPDHLFKRLGGTIHGPQCPDLPSRERPNATGVRGRADPQNRFKGFAVLSRLLVSFHVAAPP